MSEKEIQDVADRYFWVDDCGYARFRKGTQAATRAIVEGNKHDPVQRPAHYQQFGMEVIDIIRHVLGPEGFRAYCIGNELKYRLRAGDKGDAAQDMAKAQKYREFREGK